MKLPDLIVIIASVGGCGLVGGLIGQFYVKKEGAILACGNAGIAIGGLVALLLLLR